MSTLACYSQFCKHQKTMYENKLKIQINNLIFKTHYLHKISSFTLILQFNFS